MTDRAEPPARPHRPARYPDLTKLIDAAGGDWPSSHAQTASQTAATLLAAGRDPSGDVDTASLVRLADRIGLDTLAALWRDCDPVSLPGALWTLYLLRQCAHESGEPFARLVRAGVPVAAADAVVAGVGEFADAEAVARVSDDMLRGVYGGDFAVALERAAALLRVVAAGRREHGEGDRRDAADDGGQAERNERAARDLTAAARRWRAGTLH